MLDWIVVGGGIHGTYMSNYLARGSNATPDELMVIDPHEEPLAVWRRFTRNTGMEFLRSPAEHSLDIGPGSLLRFAASTGGSADLYSRYKRPSLRLFDAHCDHVIRRGDLSSFRYQAAATSIARTSDGFVVHTDRGAFESRRVILSTGASECLRIPAWAAALRQSGLVAHVFSREFSGVADRDWTSAVVVGGGISGAQVALALAKQQKGRVFLLHSRRLQTCQFDADPCWLEGRCINRLRRQGDLSLRRRTVEQSRHGGSFPEEVARHIDRAVEAGDLSTVEGTVERAQEGSGCVTLSLADGGALSCDLLILATGFEKCRPGGAFIENAVRSLDLPCAPCGYPRVDEYLRWADGLFVTGPLAELGVGPASRNIVGARLAAERIIKAVRPGRTKPREHAYYYFQRRRAGL